MDNEARALSKTVAAKIRPQYQNWRKKTGDAPAYERAYEEMVKLVASAQHISVDKAKFAARDVLQEGMDLVTQ